MQATVHRFDPETGSGAVLTDSGEVLLFTAAALEHSGLRHLRPGQRLDVEQHDGTVTTLALGTIGAVDRGDRADRGGRPS